MQHTRRNAFVNQLLFFIHRFSARAIVYDKEVPQAQCNRCETKSHHNIDPQIAGHSAFPIAPEPVEERHGKEGLSGTVSVKLFHDAG
jgi:hypothetical protein